MHSYNPPAATILVAAVIKSNPGTNFKNQLKFLIYMYDMIILGAGPAGMSAAIYAARLKLNTLIISETIGGYAAEAHKVENYPGFKSISGYELMEKFREHVEGFNIQIKEEKVAEIRKGRTFSVMTADSRYESETILLALGTRKKKLNVPGEAEFLGKGVSYCAVCDGAFFKNKVVAVAGGADSALNAALMLAEHAKKVYLVFRNEITAKPILAEAVGKNKAIENVPKANITLIKGDRTIKSIELSNGKELDVDGLFIEIGSDPAVDTAKTLGVRTDAKGSIMVDREMNTNVEGVFAAGDITDSHPKARQILTAAADGAIASLAAFNYIKSR